MKLPMSTPAKGNLLWWMIPGVLAGMPMPFIHPERRLNCGGALSAFDDDLPQLHASGVGAVVSLLNIPSDARVYDSAGFAFQCLPVPDGCAPSFEQTADFVRFVTEQRAQRRAVVVHCEAGLGRTGTVIASYLISQGETVEVAIARVRAVERVAIETSRQLRFLEEYAQHLRIHAR